MDIALQVSPGFEGQHYKRLPGSMESNINVSPVLGKQSNLPPLFLWEAVQTPLFEGKRYSRHFSLVVGKALYIASGENEFRRRLVWRRLFFLETFEAA